MFQRATSRLGSRIARCRNSTRAVRVRSTAHGGSSQRAFSQSSSNFMGASKLGLGSALLGALAMTPLAYWFLNAQNEAFAEEQVLQEDDSAVAQPADDAAPEPKKSEDEEEPPIEIDYILVGGGATSFSALRELLAQDGESKIMLVTDEPTAPYQKPPLSKDCWWHNETEMAEKMYFKDFEQGRFRSAVYAAAENYPKNVDLRLSTAAVTLDPVRKIITLSDGRKVHFRKCLLATGASPVVPAGLALPEDNPNVTTFRTATDFQNLYRLTQDANPKHITVIGGGFLGSELASAISLQGIRTGVTVSQVVPEDGVLSNVFPSYLSEFVTKRLSKDGIDMHTSAKPTAIKAIEGDKLVVQLDNGKEILTDHVVIAAGVRPNATLAEDAYLEIDKNNGGIVVNHELQARSDIYAAGDVASYWDYQLGLRRRVEHYDHAETTGRLAALNMTGDRKAYAHQPMFFGFLGNDAFQGIGICDSKLETVGVWEKGFAPENDTAAPVNDEFEQNNFFNKGAVYYLNDNRKVIGVLLWNLLDRSDEARHALLLKREFVDDLPRIKTQVYIGDKSLLESNLPEEPAITDTSA